MKLSCVLVVTFGVGVLFNPIWKLPDKAIFLADGGKKQAEPAPKPDSTKTEFALLDSQNDKEYHIIVNVPATKLTLYENDNAVLTFPVAVGQPIYKTPIGAQEIKTIEWNPWWFPPKTEWAKNEVITPPGPKNPLGPVKLPMSEDIRLHGTTKDNSIGSAASHGCVRMHSNDAVTLAWYLQSRLSEKSDPALLAKYKRLNSQTFYVKLDRPVSVSVVYDPVEISNEVLTLYPDVYHKIKDVKGLVEWKLYTSGIVPWEFNLDNIPKLSKSPQSIELTNLKTDIS